MSASTRSVCPRGCAVSGSSPLLKTDSVTVPARSVPFSADDEAALGVTEGEEVELRWRLRVDELQRLGRGLRHAFLHVKHKDAFARGVFELGDEHDARCVHVRDCRNT